MAAYKWDPLPHAETWIRILILEPGEDEQELKGSLESLLLEEGIGYNATSYCVGPTEKPHEIKLWKADGYYSLPITSSAFAMLRRFRSDTDRRRLWVDAICIDQTNDEEKADQIMLMQKIYTYTERVLIYLGEPDETTPLAIELMTRIYQAVSNTPADLKLPPLEWKRYHNMPPVTDPESWEPLKDFFCRPWFSRKWTIQECVLPAKATFYCGTWEAEWEYMNVIKGGIHDNMLPVMDHTTYSKVNLKTQLQQGIFQFLFVATTRQSFQAGRRFQLMDVCYHFQSARATDARDHLFALLGLAKNVNVPELRPAYGEATIFENCMRYARFFLQRTKTLEVLYRAGHQGQSKLLAPSWIPNWYGKLEGVDSQYDSGPWSPLAHPAFYNIARGTLPQIDHEMHDAVLRIHGVFVDKVHKLANRHQRSWSMTAPDDYFALSRSRRGMEECDSLVSLLKTCRSGESFETAFWRTLICGVGPDLRKATEDPYAAAYRAWRGYLRNDFNSRAEMTSIQQYHNPWRKAFDGSNSMSKIFGITESGYMGMFNKSTLEGDQIVAFYGGAWPFVVRRRYHDPSSAAPESDINSWDYELIGQCYIHGLMEEGQFDIKDPKHQKHCFHLGGEYEVEPPFQPHGTIPKYSETSVQSGD